MCESCSRLEKQQMEANRDNWKEFQLKAKESTVVYVKFWNDYIKVDRADFLVSLSYTDKENTCPDWDYSGVGGALYVGKL